MDREPQGGSDAGRDYERDLNDESPATIRDTAPDYLAPIDASAPVSGHSPAPTSTTSPAETPEQDWSVAREVLYPAFRPVGTLGLAVDSIDRRTAVRYSSGIQSVASILSPAATCSSNRA